MHAVVARSRIHDFDKGRAFLQEHAVPGVSQAPGFVAAYWVRLGDDRGASMILFESEEAARAMADRIPRPPEDVVTIESIDVGEVAQHVTAQEGART